MANDLISRVASIGFIERKVKETKERWRHNIILVQLISRSGVYQRFVEWKKWRWN